MVNSRSRNTNTTSLKKVLYFDAELGMGIVRAGYGDGMVTKNGQKRCQHCIFKMAEIGRFRKFYPFLTSLF